LIKEEWTITDDPLFLQFGGVDLFVDLGVEKMIAAQKDNRRIAVEIKSFLGASLISEFHTALGQLMSYRLALKQKDPQRALYLAVPLDLYSSFQLREVHSEKPNPQPLPYEGRGVRIKASLLVGERFGERSECTASNREGLYIRLLLLGQ
jgi:hypothetical protein